jgi:hypothetical protein
MKLLLPLFCLLSIHSYAANLSDFVVKKASNYILMAKTYERLEQNIKGHRFDNFCKTAYGFDGELRRIYQDDVSLVNFLKLRGFKERAEHFKENSITDYLTFESFKRHCDESRVHSLLKNYNRIKLNLSYLMSSHKMWMVAYCPRIEGKCNVPTVDK